MNSIPRRRPVICSLLPQGLVADLVCQRYQPRDAMACVVAAGIRPSHAEDDLRLAVEAARERDPYRAHWLLAYRPVEPPWSVRFTMASPDSAPVAMRTAATRACEECEPHYLYSSQEQLICANNPPAEGRFFSVTPERRWSAHDQNATQPLAGQPGMVALGFRPSTSGAFAALGGDGPRRERGATPEARPARRIGR